MAAGANVLRLKAHMHTRVWKWYTGTLAFQFPLFGKPSTKAALSHIQTNRLDAAYYIIMLSYRLTSTGDIIYVSNQFYPGDLKIRNIAPT